MATAKAKSGSNIKNNGSSILFGGNISDPNISTLDFGSTNMEVSYQGPVSGLVDKAFDSEEFSKKNSLTAMALTSSIGGVEIRVLKSGSGVENRQNTKGWRGYVRSDITSIDLLSGEISYGAAAGNYVSASGLDNTVGVLSDKVLQAGYAVPGRLVYQFGSNVPKEQSYSPKTG